ncbi:hypothetical protein HXP44_21620 [Streptomyces sioyaensis]|uniref:hypothetical protein n=1 Tax=Streptomyces sioyaensis TaxID=67364 RepID=UPI0012AB8F77|nr:hypothetical protein [Streptomyces sioyaensis]MBM4794590.1 hypothetical protein [Streptomyces sioyaensis]
MVETCLVRCLDRVRKEIADKEQRERRQAEERRPPAPDWFLEPGIGVGALPVAEGT